MFRDEKLELKVGMFIGMSIFILFFIVFSIQDISMLGKGYEIKVVFDYINGLTENSPVRLAGVNVGEVRKIEIFYDDNEKKTRVMVHVRIKGDTRIESDSVPRINTLGLLGEQYLEISPGISKSYFNGGEIVRGDDPVNVGRQMEKFNDLMQAVTDIICGLRDGKGSIGKLMSDDALYVNLVAITEKIQKGEGTIGKLIMRDELYEDMETVFARLKNGEGTIGKLLVEEKIYDDMEDFVSDIKKNPWKLLSKK